METKNEKLALKLFQEAIRLNQTGNNVFFDYSGHTEGVQVYAYKGKWSCGKERIIDTVIYLDNREASKKINRLINELKRLCNE